MNYVENLENIFGAVFEKVGVSYIYEFFSGETNYSVLLHF